MPSDQTRNVSLTAELNAFIHAQVASGHYQNASDVVRAGLRLLAQYAEREALATGEVLTPELDFLTGGGAMGALMREHDWSSSPLGSPKTWPQALRSALSTCLGSRAVSAILWGPDFRLFYNDSYRPFLDQRHPWALGKPMGEIWPTMWQAISASAQAVLDTGEGVVAESQQLMMERGDGLVESFWYYSFAPIRGETGQVEGIFLTAFDMTEQMLAKRARQEAQLRLTEVVAAAGLSADFHTLFEASPTPFIVVAPPDWTIVAANDARLRATRTTREEQIGRRLFDVFPDDPNDPGADGVRNLTASFERVVATKATDALAVQRYALREPDGRFVERWWTPFNTPVLNRDGDVALIIHRAEDVTELVRLRGDAAARDQLTRDQQEVIDRLRTSETALRASEEFNRRILASSSDCIKVLSLDGRLEFMSEGGMCVMEVDDFRDVDGSWWPEFWSGDEHAKAIEAVEEAKRGGTGRFQGFATTMKGSPRWWDVAVTPINSPDGRPEKLLSVSRDVTAAGEASIALRASEARFEAIANSIDQMIWSTLPDGYHDYYNQRWYDYTGVPQGSTDGEVWNGVFHPDDQELAWGLWRNSLATGEPYRVEYRLRHHSGQYRWVIGRAQCVRDDAGRITRWFGTCTDIHDQVEAREVLARSREELERLVEERTADRDRMWATSPDLLLVIDFQGVFQHVNPAWTEILGYSPEELVGHHVNEFVIPDDHRETTEAYELAAAGRQPRIENRYRHKDGSLRWISWTAAPAGQVTYATGRDITVEKERATLLVQAQEALRQAQKMEAVGQLTGGVAHDFNNLLTIIKSSTDLLRRPGLAEERRRRYVDAISDTVERASKLTGQLLAFARRQALKPEVFDAADRVRGVVEMLGTIVGSRIQIVTEIVSEPCYVEADVSQFETALVNMAVNARDAMDGEGKLTVRVEKLSALPPIRGHGGGSGRFVALSLVDTGHGIAPDKLSHIFEPFYTTKEVGKGTGLGLSQVFGFAKQSGGDVAVESEVGRGTTFTLYLGQTRAKGTTDATAALVNVEPAEHGRGRRVLVVEDNIEVGQFSTQILQDLGYETTWAASADEALKTLDEVEGFDVVFSDVVMPGMSGVELGHEIHKRYPGLPVVLTSGYSHVLAEEGRHGFELLQKPYAVEELSKALLRVTSRRRAKTQTEL